jgi:hypothetical protein
MIIRIEVKPTDYCLPLISLTSGKVDLILSTTTTTTTTTTITTITTMITARRREMQVALGQQHES